MLINPSKKAGQGLGADQIFMEQKQPNCRKEGTLAPPGINGLGSTQILFQVGDPPGDVWVGGKVGNFF